MLFKTYELYIFFGIIRKYLIYKNKEVKKNIFLLKNNGFDDNIYSNIYKYIKIKKNNFNYEDFIDRYKLYENSKSKYKIYRHLTQEKRYEIFSLILLNITIIDNKIDSKICNKFIKKCKFRNDSVNTENKILTPSKIINYLKKINNFYNIKESTKVFVLQWTLLNKYLN